MSRKIYPQAVLKNLPEEKQQAIILYCDGDPEHGVKGHSLQDTVNWLRADGVQTSSGAVSGFRSWFLLQAQFKLNEMAAVSMAEQDRLKKPEMTDEQFLARGQRYFSEMAVQQQDAKAWFLLKQIELARERNQLLERKEDREKQALSLQREKFEFDATKACLKKLPELKLIASDNSIDESAKIDKVRQLLFGELAE